MATPEMGKPKWSRSPAFLAAVFAALLAWPTWMVVSQWHLTIRGGEAFVCGVVLGAVLYLSSVIAMREPRHLDVETPPTRPQDHYWPRGQRVGWFVYAYMAWMMVLIWIGHYFEHGNQDDSWWYIEGALLGMAASAMWYATRVWRKAWEMYREKRAEAEGTAA